jgi:hydroxymethylglutaryl-CoA lyase
VTAQTKLEFIDKLYNAGLRSIESGAFVSPKWVPQMADTEEIFKHLKDTSSSTYNGATFSALTPNIKGMQNLYSDIILNYILCGYNMQVWRVQ